MAAAVIGSLVIAPVRTGRASIASAPTSTDETDDTRAEQTARKNVERGARLYEQARYAEALVAFEEAAEVYPLADFQYNIGLCHERLGNEQSAIDAFEAYLQGKPGAADAPSVRYRIAELERTLDPPGSAVESPEQPTALPLTPSGETRPQPSASPSPPTGDEPGTVPLEDEGDPGRTMIISGATLVGVGGAIAIAGGVAFGVYAERRADAVERVLDQGNPDELTLEETADLADEGDLYRGLQIASIGTGVAAVVTGLALIAAGRRRARQVALHPTLGPRRAGLTLEGRF